MSEEIKADDLRALVTNVREQLSYLQELGVEGLEKSVESQPVDRPFELQEQEIRSDAIAPAEHSALRRNALAAATTRKAPPIDVFPESSQSRPMGPTASGAPLLKMAVPGKSKSSAPVEPLFGTIAPKDASSLPDTAETFEGIWNDIGDCTRCPLYEGRTHIVHSEGNRQARLMLVGEAPGGDEDLQARPFVGRAGQLLNKIIEGIGFKREEVLIGNVNRCRPPANRTPTLMEAATCKPFLLREIAVVRPAVIVVLGNTAMKNLLNTKEGITKLRGKFLDYNGIKVMPTFHPAYLLRDPSKKRETWDDMKKVRDYLEYSDK